MAAKRPHGAHRIGYAQFRPRTRPTPDVHLRPDTDSLAIMVGAHVGLLLDHEGEVDGDEMPILNHHTPHTPVLGAGVKNLGLAGAH